MTTVKRKPRGRPFKPGNPGRPPGSKNKITQIVEQLAEDQAEQLVQKVVELAQAGDVSCLTDAHGSTVAAAQGPPGQTRHAAAEDIALTFSTQSLCCGVPQRRVVSPLTKPARCLWSRSGQCRSINQQELLKRIEGLERERERRDATANFETR